MKLLLTLLLTFSVATSSIADDVKKYGDEITLKEKTPIFKILENPESFVGKKVLVEGTVTGVCAKRGCWISLASDKEYESIYIKVTDGEIVFPVESKGKTALVEGEVYSIVTEDKDCNNKCEEDKDKKENCDKEKKTKKIYMIKGLGAVIK